MATRYRAWCHLCDWTDIASTRDQIRTAAHAHIDRAHPQGDTK